MLLSEHPLLFSAEMGSGERVCWPTHFQGKRHDVEKPLTTVATHHDLRLISGGNSFHCLPRGRPKTVPAAVVPKDEPPDEGRTPGAVHSLSRRICRESLHGVVADHVETRESLSLVLQSLVVSLNPPRSNGLMRSYHIG